MILTHWRILTMVPLAAAFLAGCNDGTVTVPTPPPVSNAVDFSMFAERVFSNSANSTPVSVDQNFTFDVNPEPTAFDSLITLGTY